MPAIQWYYNERKVPTMEDRINSSDGLSGPLIQSRDKLEAQNERRSRGNKTGQGKNPIG